jgi:hypothetical protein
MNRRGSWLLLAILPSLSPLAHTTSAPPAASLLVRVEAAYADFNDAQGAIALLDSDPDRYPDRSYAGHSRDAWQQIYAARRAELARDLGKLSVRDLAPTEARAVRLMRAAVDESTASPDSLAPVGHCKDAAQARLPLQPLQRRSAPLRRAGQ